VSREPDHGTTDAPTVVERAREHVRKHRSGMVVDLAFAVGWVTFVSALFGLLDAPSWAYQACLLAGIVAYYGFFASLAAAREWR
jgi:hypothetical protein